MFVQTNTVNLCPESISYCVPLPKGQAKAPEGGKFACFIEEAGLKNKQNTVGKPSK